MNYQLFCHQLFLIILLWCSFSFTSHAQSADDPRQFIELYLDALSSDEWAELIPPFMPTKQVASDFVSQHRIFRNAFANYAPRIKHLVVEGNRAVAWLRVSARHVGAFPYDEFAAAKPSGKIIAWDEVWYFDVKSGKFGSEWDFLVNGVARMKALGVRCLVD